MTLKGKWRIVEMALWDLDFLDMMEPAYILFDGTASGEFAFGCVTGQIHCRPAAKGADFTWKGNNEMDDASGDGWAELQDDGIGHRRNPFPQRRRLHLYRPTRADFFNSLLEHFPVHSAPARSPTRPPIAYDPVGGRVRERAGADSTQVGNALVRAAGLALRQAPFR